MRKAILISIKPEWVAKILNGEKTIEIRKTVPKCGFPIDVYIYCSKGKNLQECEFWSFEYPGSFKAFVTFSEEFPVGKEQFFLVEKDSLEFDGDYLATIGKKVRQEIDDFESSSFEALPSINGKVVAKFTLKNADEFGIGDPYEEHTRSLLDEACVTIAEARKYMGGKHPYYLCGNSLYAWHISDLEVFDEPKEVSEFYIRPGDSTDFLGFGMVALERAPQSWQYVGVKE